MDFYLDNRNVYDRLASEYLKYGKLIIAYDFDDTVYDFHNKGRKYNAVVELLRRWRPYAELIVFSGAKDERVPGIEEYLDSNDIPYDCVNGDSSIPTGARKIYYNALLDDRAGLATIYACLLELITKIEKGEILK